MFKKQNKLSPKNTLFKYFAKSPASSPAVPKVSVTEKENSGKEVNSQKKLDFGKRSQEDDENEDIDEIDVVIKKNTKKRRRIVEDSSEDDEQPLVKKEDVKDTPKLPKFEYNSQISDENLESKKISDDNEILQHKTPSKKEMVDKREPENIEITQIWTHESLDFLQPENIKDSNGNRPSDPDYDEKTLYVPKDFLNKCSPGLRQWWVLKQDHFNCIFFFKVGKFYELYHHDAVIGVKELGLSFMKGEFAHSGFPEKAYDKMVSGLVEKGYNVARIEQTETPDMMQARCAKNKTNDKFSKVMNREICQITNKGTQLFSYGQQSLISAFNPNYLLSIIQDKTSSGISSTETKYGICFLDTTIGNFTLGEFIDDQRCSRLLTLLAHFTPVLIIYEKNGLSSSTVKLIKNLNAIKEPLLNEKQFWNAEKTVKYFNESVFVNGIEWPTELHGIRDLEQPLMAKALGGCVWYLQHHLIEKQVLATAEYNLYTPPDKMASIENLNQNQKKQRTMVLDSITLHNLNLLGEDISLFSKMDFCCTKFGKRKLMGWLSAPSCDIKEIASRHEAVEELCKNAEVHMECRLLLKGLPDLERHIVQIHGFGNKAVINDHPNSRAILYEALSYGRKKIADFIATIKAFEQLMKIPKIFAECKSELLVILTQTPEQNGQFKDMKDKLDFFKSAFNFEEALKTGTIIPESGVDEDYDEVIQEIKNFQDDTMKYLKDLEDFFGCKLKYFGCDRRAYQIEIPEKNCHKVTHDFTLHSTRKNSVKRYYTNETREFLKKSMQLESKKMSVLNGIARRIFEKFSLDFTDYKKICNIVSQLDVLSSLAEYAKNQNVICKPTVHEMVNENSFIKLDNGIHPLLNSESFIPNGIEIPKGDAYFELITGPNMGGKSTLMREIALLCIMAQIGSLVPADSLSMTIIDRIFTRLGANDNIMAGQSTFLVELDETSTILKHCTPNSLVLLDELGRGTSTYDGTAIAGAVANYLANLKCRTLFSTHYHSLVDNFYGDSRINLGHMACVVENEGNDDITNEDVTFLYKYTEGSCPKSYGFNAAKIAGIKFEIIRRAHQISKKVESDVLKRKIVTKLLRNDSSSNEIMNLIKKYQKCII